MRLIILCFICILFGCNSVNNTSLIAASAVQFNENNKKLFDDYKLLKSLVERDSKDPKYAEKIRAAVLPMAYILYPISDSFARLIDKYNKVLVDNVMQKSATKDMLKVELRKEYNNLAAYLKSSRNAISQLKEYTVKEILQNLLKVDSSISAFNYTAFKGTDSELALASSKLLNQVLLFQYHSLEDTFFF